jgi:hypothetical protein
MFKFNNIWKGPISTILGVFFMIGLCVMVSRKDIDNPTFLALGTVALGAILSGPTKDNSGAGSPDKPTE